MRSVTSYFNEKGDLQFNNQQVNYYPINITDEQFKEALMNDSNFMRITYTLFDKKMSSGLVKRDLAFMLL